MAGPFTVDEGDFPTLLALTGLVDDHERQVFTTDQIDATRLSLIRHIWDLDALPTDRLPDVTADVESPIEGLTNLARCDQLDRDCAITTAEGPDVVPLRAYHFVPDTGALGRCAFVCDGHTCDPTAGNIPAVVQGLLTAGWDVFAYLMPATAIHATLFSTVLGKCRAFEPFVEMPIACLNYALTLGLERPVATGLSGGGWTTKFWAALDTRIEWWFCMAGSMPLYMRYDGSIGDIEQYQAHLHTHAGELDQLMLACWDREGHYGFNRSDNCCFAESMFEPDTCPARLSPGGADLSWDEALADFVSEIDTAVTSTGGSLAYMTTESDVHTYHADAVTYLLANLPE